MKGVVILAWLRYAVNVLNAIISGVSVAVENWPQRPNFNDGTANAGKDIDGGGGY